MTPEPLPPAHITRYWFVNRKGAIDIEFEDGSNVAEIRVRRTGGETLVKHVEMRENTGAWNSPQQTWEWMALAETAFLGVDGWKSERNFA